MTNLRCNSVAALILDLLFHQRIFLLMSGVQSKADMPKVALTYESKKHGIMKWPLVNLCHNHIIAESWFYHIKHSLADDLIHNNSHKHECTNPNALYNIPWNLILACFTQQYPSQIPNKSLDFF